MEHYKILKVAGQEHVLRHVDRSETFYLSVGGEKVKNKLPDANYLGTGMALCGVLRKGESLKKFLKRTNNSK